MRIIVTLLVLFFIITNLFAQRNDEYFDENYLRYEDYIYKPNIHTLLVHRQGWQLSYPVIDLNSADKIEISFDDFSEDVGDYYYKLIHCTADWKPSDIMYADYSEGFEENQLTEYAYSFNTLVHYIHYSIAIPNDDVKPKLSGNYLVKIYDNYDEEDLVATARFSVVEHEVEIEADIKRPSLPDKSTTGQEVDFTVKYNNYRITDPFQEVSVVVKQNYRSDNELRNLKPVFVKNNELVYDYNKENVFDAGAEFRYFDAKSVRFQADRIASIDYEKPFYHFHLIPDESRYYGIYIYHQDLNGKRLVNIQEGEDSSNEADYVKAHFTLPAESPAVDGNFYIFGALSNWQFRKENMLSYNFDTKAYELELMVKQGYYNYQYLFLRDKTTVADVRRVEGSHFETENDYLIYVYHHDFSMRYDKLVGFKKVNTLKRL